ncbi:hypothetical protein BO85DRAFT_173667 [Aspergillus piperis CBS 112811]|uniref:Uncharacterized protein n=1 Tax=Aspergillus piperis CBS 112811 TaxID=1448313 RepID=A0A8G1QUF7_9EURO|nr:hypothetical protein BO85DRAFT_173667 [Aspergillus piperis CBS 112811]RAH52799.1 hypothetical protein BO85DRAFT_173667 [Aspergillus piperis CBS 112811]
MGFRGVFGGRGKRWRDLGDGEGRRRDVGRKKGRRKRRMRWREEEEEERRMEEWRGRRGRKKQREMRREGGGRDGKRRGSGGKRAKKEKVEEGKEEEEEEEKRKSGRGAKESSHSVSQSFGLSFVFRFTRAGINQQGLCLLSFHVCHAAGSRESRVIIHAVCDLSILPLLQENSPISLLVALVGMLVLYCCG